MPYIAPEARIALDNEVTRGIETVGELNYMITTGLLEVPLEDLAAYIRYTIGSYVVDKTPSYTLYNGAIGACMCALLEFGRRTKCDDTERSLIMADVIYNFYTKVVAPYEDDKIKENGDIEGYANYHGQALQELTPEEEITHAQGVSERPDHRA